MLLAQHGQLQLQNNKRYSVNSLIQCGLQQLQQICTQIGKIHATSIQKTSVSSSSRSLSKRYCSTKYTGTQNYSSFMGYQSWPRMLRFFTVVVVFFFYFKYSQETTCSKTTVSRWWQNNKRHLTSLTTQQQHQYNFCNFFCFQLEFSFD